MSSTGSAPAPWSRARIAAQTTARPESVITRAKRDAFVVGTVAAALAFALGYAAGRSHAGIVAACIVAVALVAVAVARSADTARVEKFVARDASGADPAATEAALREAEARASLAAQSARVAEAFEAAALATALPEFPGTRFTSAHRARRPNATAGGDWYDVLRLPDGRAMFTIGDVAGSDLAAAVTMSVLRHSLRGAALTTPDPTRILAAADGALRDASPGRMATAFLAIYDPITRQLVYASAGHPAPLVREPSGAVTELQARGDPLGTTGEPAESREIALPPRAVLVLYTDGLTEAGRNLPQGERRLRMALENGTFAASANPAEALLGQVAGSAPSDDVAVLIATLHADEHERFRHWTFDASDRLAARDVRAAFASSLVAYGADERHLAAAEALYAELFANVVAYSGGPIDVTLDAFGPVPIFSILDRNLDFETARSNMPVSSVAAAYTAAPRPGGGMHIRARLRAFSG